MEDEFSEFGAPLSGEDQFAEFGSPVKEESELPVEQKQGVDAKTRAVVKNLVDENPELQTQYLERKGFDVKRSDSGQIQVKKPGDKSWSVVDPKGFDAQDILDHTADAVTLVADAAGLAIGGILGAAAAGAATETVRQNLGKMVGARDEVDMGQIAKVGAVGGLMAGAGKVIKGAKGLISTLKTPGVKEAAVKAAVETGEIVGKTPLLGPVIKQSVKAGKAIKDVVSAAKAEKITAAQGKVSSIASRIEAAKSPAEIKSLQSQLTRATDSLAKETKGMSPKKLSELKEMRLQAREARLGEAAAAKKPRSFADTIMETAEQAAQRKKLESIMKGK